MKMNTSAISLGSRKKRLLQDRDLRNKYVRDQIKIGLRNQLRALRDDRGWTQGELAELIGTKQSVISRIEKDPVRVGIPVYLDIAEKLDVAFVVRFEAIDTFAHWYDNPSQRKMAPPSSEAILSEEASLNSDDSQPQASENFVSVNSATTISDGTPFEPFTDSEVTWFDNVDVIDDPKATRLSITSLHATI